MVDRGKGGAALWIAVASGTFATAFDGYEMMQKFRPPDGMNFHCAAFVPIAVVSRDLCRIASFLQDLDSAVSLERFDDWWEHDGPQFNVPRGKTDLHGLFALVGSPMAIHQSMPGDAYVRVGIVPVNREWYLRFYVDWDDRGWEIEGDYDITLAGVTADAFRMEVVPKLEADIGEGNSREYFDGILA